MLERLTIDNYVLIDHLEVNFPGGLIIITGETGAGKSILLGGLSLLFGAKAEVEALRNKERNCVVEAQFSDSDGIHFIRRVISPAGRSRAFFDDEPVSLEELRRISSGVADIHSQNQQLKLSERKFKLGLIDGYAANGGLLSEYVSLYESWQSKKRELSELRVEKEAFEKERDYLEFQYSKLAEAGIVEGELSALEEEHSSLANGETIRTYLEKAESCFESGDVSLDSYLKEIGMSLERVSQFIPQFSELSSRIESARIELKDIQDEVCSRADALVFSPERLEEVESRLSTIYDLFRKYAVDDEKSLIAVRNEMKSRLDDSESADDRCDELAAECSRLETELNRLASEIHSRRASKAPELSELLQKSIRFLEMPQASFQIVVNEKKELGADGSDDVVLLFDANGKRLQDLTKCASGGELSRIMLCIKALMSKYVGMPTIIFDEIDTGVSGSIADKMGRTIVEMSSSMQVFAITHLPQVASKGDAHFLVYKKPSEDGMLSHIKPIDGEERVKEIARMLSGERLSAEALANARVLLNEN